MLVKQDVKEVACCGACCGADARAWMALAAVAAAADVRVVLSDAACITRMARCSHRNSIWQWPKCAGVCMAQPAAGTAAGRSLLSERLRYQTVADIILVAYKVRFAHRIVP